MDSVLHLLSNWSYADTHEKFKYKIKSTHLLLCGEPVDGGIFLSVY